MRSPKDKSLPVRVKRRGRGAVPFRCRILLRRVMRQQKKINRDPDLARSPRLRGAKRMMEIIVQAVELLSVAERSMRCRFESYYAVRCEGNSRSTSARTLSISAPCWAAVSAQPSFSELHGSLVSPSHLFSGSCRSEVSESIS